MTALGRRAVVTGGAGFIGSHLTRALLAAGVETTVLDDLSTGRRDNLPRGVRLVEGDVRDPAILKRVVAGTDVVFNLAAIASVARCEEELHRSHSINLGGTVAMIEAVRDTAPAAPIIYASSAAVYGHPERSPITEDAAPRPINFYGLDKLAGEKALALGASMFGLTAVALRLFNVYGARQDPRSPYSGVISKFTDRLASGVPTVIDGDGLQSRDFISVEDVAHHFVAAAEVFAAAPRGAFEVLNVCTGTGTTINALHAMIAAALGVAAPSQHAPAKSCDIRHSCGDPAKALATLALEAPTPLETGLPAYISSSLRENM